jgi:hypothetical protein
MGFWERLIGVEPAAQKESRHFLTDLLDSYREEARLARQLRAHADRSPHQAGRQWLRTAAAAQDRILQFLRDKIEALGGTPVDEIGLVKEGKNHWARVVHDLEDNHALERRYNEQVIYWDPDVPDAASFFLTLQQEKLRLNAMLREIVVRADPHALN